MLKADNINQLSLTTDYYGNESTIAFYKSMNFNVLYEFIAYPKRRMYRFIKKNMISYWSLHLDND